MRPGAGLELCPVTLQPWNPGEKGSCPFKGSGKDCGVTVSGRDRRLELVAATKNKFPRKPRSCSHIGSSKAARLQNGSSKVQARLPTAQPGTLSKARNNVKRKTKSPPALVPSKMCQPEVQATGFQRGSSKVHQVSARFHQQGSSRVP